MVAAEVNTSYMKVRNSQSTYASTAVKHTHLFPRWSLELVLATHQTHVKGNIIPLSAVSNLDTPADTAVNHTLLYQH